MLTDKINGDADRHASVHLAKQYDLIVSLYSPMCIISFSLLLMLDCMPS